ncbi:uncharacterized protein BDZ99DRAFT_553569 [Mytilinidion resinicola]|uniref:F-box domain-containing protein n=1 Tax=Mytilinidion resinicola TaxID=574789 RepID=A0A6A6YXR5_9PEZI|nr:uncharacterized protein BDZ99DRAFT_553569 [Mytilinidion resinicola]KAF2813712.1 hypothetical protein BDZ99DRAFT_553569 [Mytilinidion resinicola]
MLRFLSFHRKSSLSTEEPPASVDAPRPCGTGQLEKRSSVSSVTSTRPSRDSIYSKESSATSYSSVQSTTHYDFDTIPTITKTAWELDRYRRPSVTQRSRSTEETAPRTNLFEKLPREIYDCILQELELLHFQPGKHVCPSCYLRDVSNLALTSRAWDKAARAKLYRNIWVLPDDGNHEMKKLKLKNTRRLKLLRRTLRERTALARTVKELNCQNYQEVYRKADIFDKGEIVDMIASVVMACPDLEKLTGFHVSYNHSFDRLSHALSTRNHLKERIWLLKPPSDPATPTSPTFPRNSDSNNLSNLYDPTADLTETFLAQHSFWPSLTTLILHSQSSSSSPIMTFRAFIATFRSLPSLSNLSLSFFSAAEFSNRTLAALPPLQSLRLEKLPGLTDAGLQRYFAQPAAASIVNLSLINLQITDLAVLGKIFQYLSELSRLTLSQNPTPRPSEDAWPLPASTDAVFRSASLRYLHWSCLTPHPPTTVALGKAIKDGDLPALRTLRAPTDDGTLQAVCAPRASIAREGDETAVNIAAVVADQQRKHRTRASMIVQPTPTLTPTPKSAKRTSMLDLRPSRLTEMAADPNATKATPQLQIQTAMAVNAKGKWKRVSTPVPPSSVFTRPEPKTLISPLASPPLPKPNLISLPAARIAAQHRLAVARKLPGIKITITSPSGVDVKKWTMGSYLGLVQGPCVARYCLDPDIEGDGEDVVVTGVAEVVGGARAGGGRRQGEEPVWERVRVRGCLHPGGRGGDQVGADELF